MGKTVSNRIGLSLELREELNRILSFISAMDDTVELKVTPATLGTAAAVASTGLFERDVLIQLVNSSDEVVEYDIDVAVAVADVTAGDGTSAISGGYSTIGLIKGEAIITIVYSGTWAEADTNTLTVSSSATILGSTISNVTSVDTIIA